MPFKFEQEANFWYLSGLDHPDWWLIIDGDQGRTWLVKPEVDEVRQIFDGSLDAEMTLKVSGANAVIDRTEARRLLPTLRARHRIVYTLLPQAVRSQYGFHPNPAQAEMNDELRMFEVRDCRKEIATLRAIKQPIEIQAIQKAVDITIDGFKSSLSKLGTLKNEYEIEAILDYKFKSLGASGHAYDPIVAGGSNACTLHYVNNNQALKKQDWLLMDVGAKYNHYCADITRTFPLGKQFTKRQLAVYEAVLRVHNTAVKLCHPGTSVSEYQKQVEAVMTSELESLKLIGPHEDSKRMRAYFPHAISHGLGLDVQDPLGAPVLFKAGMVLTVEPGIYLHEENLGIRIENDILITEEGPRNLSKRLPNDINSLLKLQIG